MQAARRASRPRAISFGQICRFARPSATDSSFEFEEFWSGECALRPQIFSSGKARVAPSCVLQVQYVFRRKRKSIAVWSEATELTVHLIRGLQPRLYFSIDIFH